MRSAAQVVAVMIVAGCCAATGTATADPDAPPGPKTGIDHDGSYAVGTDIVPGTYSSAGPAGDSACYWKRVNGDQIVDNALTKKPQIVQIEPTDTVFKTSRCQPWQKTDCPPTCATSQPRPQGLPNDLKDLLTLPPQAAGPAPQAPGSPPGPPPQVPGPPPQIPGVPPGPPPQVPGPPPQVLGPPPGPAPVSGGR